MRSAHGFRWRKESTDYDSLWDDHGQPDGLGGYSGRQGQDQDLADRDNTAENADILVFSGVDADTSRDALFAFTDCEMSLSPIAVSLPMKPSFLMTEILKASAHQTQVS